MRQTRTLVLVAVAALGFAAGGCDSNKVAPSGVDASQVDVPTPKPHVEPAKPKAPTYVIAKKGRDGREMVKVPAGEFLRGSVESVGRGEEHPQKRIKLREFWIDRDEVSVAAFAQCVKAGGCKEGTYRKEVIKKKSTRPPGCSYGLAARADHPMNCVGYDGAKSYCKWAQKRLPTEAEWERAARGDDGRTYPWGEDPADCTRACMVQGTKYGCGQRTTCPVRSRAKGISPYGAFDMAGNVYEWVQDTYDKGYYAKAPDDNPVNTSKGVEHPVRGGAYSSDSGGVRTAQRSAFPANERTSFVGFRCAAD